MPSIPGLPLTATANGIRGTRLRLLRTAVLTVFFGSLAHPGYTQPKLISQGASPSGAPTSIATSGANLLSLCAHGGAKITSSLGNTFHEIVQDGGYGGSNVSLYVALNPKTGTEQLAAAGYPFTAQAFSGVASGPDRVSVGTNLYPPSVTAPITPTSKNELLLSCFIGQFPRVPNGFATAAGMTTLGQAFAPNAVNGVAAAYLVQSTAAPVAATWNNNEANGQASLLTSFFSIVNPAPLAITTKSIPEAVLGQQYHASPGHPYCLASTGGIAPITWAKTSGNLPAGMDLDPRTGCFSATKPTAAVFQTPVTFSATDAHGTVVKSDTLHLTAVNTALRLDTTRCNNGTQLQAYAGCSVKVTGGTGTYSFAVAKDGATYLPEGMVLNPSTGVISSARINGQGHYTPTITVTDTGSGTVTGPIDFAINGNNSAENVKTLFPPDHVLRIRVDSLPLDTHPYASLLSGYGAAPLRAIFGPDVGNGGIPINTVGDRQPMVPVNKTQFFYAEITQTFSPCDAAIENYWTSTGVPPGVGASNDNHILTLRTGAHPMIQELYQGYPDFPKQTFGAPGCTSFGSGGRDIYGGAVQWDPSSYVARPDGVSGADAGGLCLTCYLLKYDEVVDGPAGHAIRATWRTTMAGHLFPATVQAAGVSGPNGGGTSSEGLIDPSHPPTAHSGKTPEPSNVPPMGLILRLKASVREPSGCSSNPITHNIFLTLKQYGEIVADNGLNGGLVGTQDSRWPSWAVLNGCLNALHGSDLEGVNIQPSLVDWPKSYRIKTGNPAGSAAVEQPHNAPAGKR